MVESQYGRGSIFSIDVDEREYWITARHILTGVDDGPPFGSITTEPLELQILDADATSNHLLWRPMNFTVIDPGDQRADVMVLAPPRPILDNPLPSMVAGSNGAVFGGDCQFLGFAYGGGWRSPIAGGRTLWLPFVKHCTISAHIVDERIWILDGINNGGFSGGPVIFGTGQQQKILGVISGYWLEPAEVIYSISAPPPPKATVGLNSGFIIAYDISYAIDAIHKNPAGPLRKAK
jgi:hypothetical protein